MTPAEYLASIRERLIADPLVISFKIRLERLTPSDGHIRAVLTLSDGSGVEFSEYFRSTNTGQITAVTYSCHWSDAAGSLIRRWDNTPHHRDLPDFPHHIHAGSTGDARPGHPMSLFAVLDEISRIQAQ